MPLWGIDFPPLNYQLTTHLFYILYLCTHFILYPGGRALNYTDLTPHVQDSFKRDILVVIEEAAKEMELYEFTEPLDFDMRITLSAMLDDKADYTKEPWADFIFTLEDEDFELLAIEQLKEFKEGQPTKEQLSLYQELSMQLGKELIIPTDFLEFTYELAQLEELYKAKSPATLQAKNELRNNWFEETGEKLKLPRNVTNEKIEEYYILLEELPFKPIKNVRMSLIDKNVRMYQEVAIVKEGFEEITRNDYELLIQFDADKAQYELKYAPSYPKGEEWDFRYVSHSGQGYCAFCGKDYDVDKDHNELCNELEYSEETSKQLYKNYKEMFTEQKIPVRDAARL